MPDMIVNGTGDGYKARVDSKNRLRCYVVDEEESTWINRVEKEMYSGAWDSNGIKAATAGNIIIYLKNTNTSKDLIIIRVRHRCEDANGSLSFWLNVTGTPGGSLTTLTPANRNAGANNSADCLYYLSTDITGLSGGRRIGSIYGKSGEEFENADPCSGYILPPNSTFVIKADNNTSTHFGGIAFYLRDADLF